MAMIKKVIVILFCIPVLFMMGCTEKASTEDRMAAEKFKDLSEQIEKMNEQLVQYESDLAENEKTIKELQDQIESTFNSQREMYNELHNSAYINKHLLNLLPDITRKQGLIKEIHKEDENSLTIDYASWEENKDAPNDGEVINKQVNIEQVSVHPDVEVFILDGAMLGYQTFEDFELPEYDGLYNLYFIKNEVVLITQQYLP
jgi:predicted RNase H-like nuclease (RuvC/YqgF family)